MNEPGGADQPIKNDRFSDRPQTREEAILTQDQTLRLLRIAYRNTPDVLRLLQWQGRNYELPLSRSGNPMYQSIYGSRIVTSDTIEISFGAVRNAAMRAESDPKDEGFRFQRPALHYTGDKDVETEHVVLTAEGNLKTTPSRNRVLRAPGSVEGSQAILRFVRSFHSVR